MNQMLSRERETCLRIERKKYLNIKTDIILKNLKRAFIAHVSAIYRNKYFETELTSIVTL